MHTRSGVNAVELLVNPFLLYGAIALGGIGVCVALPRRGVNPQILGASLAAIAGLVVIGALSLSAPDALPNLHFYVFAAIALGSALRVITHPRPVYAALYFILVVLSSAGLYLLLSAEFMAFALIIIYAGAILITYLFVIMLATQSPTEDRVDVLADYDVAAREPVLATGASFVLLAVLTTLFFSGVNQLPQPRDAGAREALMAEMPRRVESAMRRADTLAAGESLVFLEETPWALDLDHEARTVMVQRADGVVEARALPGDLRLRNVESLAFNFLNEHPATIEIAGVILLMAMLGATVLSRRQVEVDEDLKAQQAASLRLGRAMPKGDAGAAPSPGAARAGGLPGGRFTSSGGGGGGDRGGEGARP